MGLLFALVAVLVLLVVPSVSETSAQRYAKQQAEMQRRKVAAWKKMIREGQRPGETTVEMVARVNLFWNLA
jgi:hypothetical protein